eukprot:gene7957-8600_t
MGSGSSVDFSAQEKETITHKLKGLYAELKTGDHSDKDIQTKLSQEYARLAETLKPKAARPTSPHQRNNSVNESSMKSPHHLAPTHASFLKVHAPGAVPATKSTDSADSAPPTLSSQTPNNIPINSNRRAGGGRTRRRSFDVEPKNRRGRETAGAVKLAETNDVLTSKSAAQLPNVTDIAVDSWDSVTQQPFCEICKMAFKSVAFLERHIKYSNLHTENVRRLEQGDSSVVETHSATVITQEQIRTTKQEEGIHYRLLYSGSKFYWRCQQSIDLDIYHHFLSNSIEIIAFHTNKQKELPRIYLDYELVLHQVNDSIKEEINQRKAAILSDKFINSNEIDETKLRLEVTLIKVVTYVLQRITYDPKLPSIANHLNSLNHTLATGSKDGTTATESLKALNNTILAVSEANGPSSGSFSVSANGGEDFCGFMALFGDDVKLFPVLHEPPITLVPINVVRRRRSTAEEFDSEMRSVDKDQSIIKANIEKAQEFTKANSRAEKIADFVYTAAQLIKEKKYRYQNIQNRYQRLWLWAIHRTIHQNNVLKNRNILNERGLNYLPKSPYKPARIRDHELIPSPDIDTNDPTLDSINNLIQA